MTFRIAFKALGRNKMRTGLTMLGMIIGVSAVITLVAMGNGAQSVIEDQIKGAGTNMITVNAGNASQGGVRGGAGTSSALTRGRCRGDPRRSARRSVPGGRRHDAGAGGRRQPELVHAHPGHRCRSAADSRLADPHAAASSARRTSRARPRWRCSARRSTTRCSAPTPTRSGQVIRIRNQPFKVIGVMAAKGQSGMGPDMDDQILAPYTTVMKKLMGATSIREITRLGGVAPSRRPASRTASPFCCARATRSRPGRTTTSSSAPPRRLPTSGPPRWAR